MKGLKKLFFSCTLLLISLHNYAQYTDQINSNRPGLSMSAYSVGKSVFQIESGVFGMQQKQTKDSANYKAKGIGVDATLRYGLLKEQLEIVGNLQYLNLKVTNNKDYYFKGSDFKQMTLGAKYLLYDPYKKYKRQINVYSWKENHKFDKHQLIPAVSIYAGANFTEPNNPFSFEDEKKITPKATLITQNLFDEGRWVFITNFTYDYIASNTPSFNFILTLTHGFNKSWSGFLEYQHYNSNIYKDGIGRGGIAYLLNENMQIDASISSNMKNNPSLIYGGIGFSWRYDAMHEDEKFTEEGTKIKKKKK